MAVSWARAIGGAIALCRSNRARLPVVDTLSQWADLRGDMENQAGDAFAALQPLQQAAGEGIAVIFLQHERKSGGDAADAGRGSSAFAGAVDTLVSFRRPLGDVRGNLRLLLALSRFEAVPPELYVARDDGRYTVVGESPGFAAQKARASILAQLPATEDAAVPLPKLLQAAGVRRSLAQSMLDELLNEGHVGRAGSGRRASPYRYWSKNTFLPPIE